MRLNCCWHSCCCWRPCCSWCPCSFWRLTFFASVIYLDTVGSSTVLAPLLLLVSLLAIVKLASWCWCPCLAIDLIDLDSFLLLVSLLLIYTLLGNAGLFRDQRYRTDPWCRNADAGLRQLTTWRNADAGLTFFRHSDNPTFWHLE